MPRTHDVVEAGVAACIVSREHLLHYKGGQGGVVDLNFSYNGSSRMIVLNFFICYIALYFIINLFSFNLLF